MKAIAFYLVLRPLIVANYWLRRRRLIADKWFWADGIAFSWGYIVE